MYSNGFVGWSGGGVVEQVADEPVVAAAVDWSAVAGAVPGAASFGAVSAACPAGLSPAQLPDLIVATDRLISHLQAVQVAAVAEFSLPGRSGSMQKLIDALEDKTGLTTRADGSTDDFAVQCLIVERARSMAAAEVGAALHQSPMGAARRVADAVELAQELPATLASLRTGRIDLPRARTIAARTADLTPDLRARVEAAVLPLAQSRTPGQLVPMIDRRVIAADPSASRKRAIAARRDRFVDHCPSVDGMGMIRAHLPAEGAVSVYDLLDRIARATAGTDDRPIAARRADALVDVCTQLLTDGYVHVGDGRQPDCSAQTTPPSPANGTAGTTGAGSGESASASEKGPLATGPTPVTSTPAPTAEPVASAAGGSRVRLSKVSTQQGRGAHFNLTMSLAAFTRFNTDPAELTGHGMIPAHIALAMQKSIRSLAVIITDTHGHAMAVGGTTYLPSQLIRDQVIAAAGTCRFPSCRISARSADLDHRESFNHTDPARGGRTTAAGLDPQCRHHHVIKTFTDWVPVRDPADGLSMNWTSPTDHRYLDHPKEHALPEQEHATPQPPAADTADASDPDAPTPCTCTCGHGHPSDLTGGSTAQIQAEQTVLLIARQQQRDLDAEELAEKQQLFLGNRPKFIHYIGPTSRPWPEDDRTDEEFNAEVQAYIATCESFEEFKADQLKVTRRIYPLLHAVQRADDYQRAHPDPNEPPF